MEHYPFEVGGPGHVRLEEVQLFCLSKSIINIMPILHFGIVVLIKIVLVVDSQGHHVNKQKNDLVESETIYVYDRLKNLRDYIKVLLDMSPKKVDNGRKFERIQTQYSHKNNFGFKSFDIAQNILVELMMIVV